jgi:hypothetical protein
LGWFKNNESRFPKIAAVARSLLAIPASSIPSERAFSAGGTLITDRRTCLASSTVRASILLRNWQKEKFGSEPELLAIPEYDLEAE